MWVRGTSWLGNFENVNEIDWPPLIEIKLGNFQQPPRFFFSLEDYIQTRFSIGWWNQAKTFTKCLLQQSPNFQLLLHKMSLHLWLIKMNLF
jgi:hypothetical protein